MVDATFSGGFFCFHILEKNQFLEKYHFQKNM